MWKFVKQALDRWAIRAAARSLPREPASPPPVDPIHLLAREDLLHPPETRTDLEFSGNGCFSFPSVLASRSSRNNRVHGRLFRAGENWRSKPLVVIIHGWNAEFHYLTICPRLARGLNERGLNAAIFELPYHLQRRPSRSEGMPDFISNDIPGMIDATRQAVADMHSLLLWARAQGCPKTALWGFSLGAWLAGHHLVVSAAQDAAVLTIPVSNLERAVYELEFCHPIRSALSIAPAELTALNLAAHRPKIAPDKILLVEGIYDLFVPADTVKHLASAWGIPSWKRLKQSHISMLFSRGSMRECMDWLRDTLIEVHAGNGKHR